MAPASTSLDNCALQIEWTTPQDGGSDIIAYTIEILGSSKEFYPVDFCGQNAESACFVPMDTLK
jgi:hypothetical protein